MTTRDRIISFCDKAIYWEIIAIPFVASFSSAAVNIFIGFLAFTFLAKQLSGGIKNTGPNPIDIPFAFLIIIGLASFVNSINIGSSIQGIFKLLKYGALILIVPRQIRDSVHIKRIIMAALLGLLLASLDGVYQLIFGVDFFRHKPYDTIIGLARLKAAFPHTNIFAGYLALFLPVSTGLFLYHFKARSKLYSGIITFLGLFCLLFTFCRSAVLGFWLAILIMGFIRRDKLVVSLLIAAMVIAPFILPKGIRKWSKTTHSVAEFLMNKERFVLNETSLNMIKYHPVLGVGVNTYSLNYQRYKLHDTDEGTANTMWYAHNSFLQMAGETGVLGLGAFLWLLAVLFRECIKFYSGRKDDFSRIAALGIIMGVFAFLVNGLTETNLYYPKIAVLFWFEVSLLLGFFNLKKEGAK